MIESVFQNTLGVQNEGKVPDKQSIRLACSNLKHSFSFQSVEGGASGIKTKSASDDKAVTRARYLNQQICINTSYIDN